MKLLLCLAFFAVVHCKKSQDNISDAMLNSVINFPARRSEQSWFPSRQLYLAKDDPQPHTVFETPYKTLQYQRPGGDPPGMNVGRKISPVVRKFMPTSYCGADVIQSDLLLVNDECAPMHKGILSVYAFPDATSDLFGHPHYYQDGHGPVLRRRVVNLFSITEVTLVDGRVMRNVVLVELDKPLPHDPPQTLFPSK